MTFFSKWHFLSSPGPQDRKHSIFCQCPRRGGQCVQAVRSSWLSLPILGCARSCSCPPSLVSSSPPLSFSFLFYYTLIRFMPQCQPLSAPNPPALTALGQLCGPFLFWLRSRFTLDGHRVCGERSVVSFGDHVAGGMSYSED